MTRPSFDYAKLTAFVLAALIACGGGGPSRPGPLSNLLDEVHIARVPPDQRPAVAQTQNDYQLARSEQLTADTNVKESDTSIKLAKGEVDQAVIEEKNAKLKQKDADASADLNRKNAAAADLRVAQLGRKAADAKLAYVKAKRSYDWNWFLFTEHDTYAKQAKWELEKAKVAKANGIQPAGFSYDKFESQYRSRSEAAQRSKRSAEKEKARMNEKFQAWKNAERDWNQARGVDTAGSQ
jgi:hypothetical protein